METEEAPNPAGRGFLGRFVACGRHDRVATLHRHVAEVKIKEAAQETLREIYTRTRKKPDAFSFTGARKRGETAPSGLPAVRKSLPEGLRGIVGLITYSARFH